MSEWPAGTVRKLRGVLCQEDDTGQRVVAIAGTPVTIVERLHLDWVRVELPSGRRTCLSTLDLVE